MRNNIQNDIKVENAKNFKSKFDLSGTVCSTASIGEVGVLFSRLLQPDTKAMVGTEQLVRTAPLVAPTYAKQHYRTWHQFVPISEVFQNYSSLMTKIPISRNGTTLVANGLPCLPKRVLSAFSLNGSKCSVYFRQYRNTSHPEDVNAQFYDMSQTDATFGPDASYWEDLLDEALYDVFTVRADGSYAFNVSKLLDLKPVLGSVTPSIVLESGNDTKFSFINANWQTNYDGAYIREQVTPESADHVVFRCIEYDNSTWTVAYCFKLSSWGMHYQKILRGLGIGIDFDDDTPKSVLPLVATYKAYWNIFGLSMWQNFESTYCSRFKSYMESQSIYQFFVAGKFETSCFTEFVLTELGSLWVTEKNDYISAHLPQPTISKTDTAPLVNIVDVYSSGAGVGKQEPHQHISVTDSSDPMFNQPGDYVGDGHARTNVVEHGHLDSEVLKRLYKSTNRNTALGRKIDALMRARGLGTYMERIRVDYIGDTDVEIDISSVTSLSDTFDPATGKGSELGQYGGKAVGYKSGAKKLFFKTSELGWWIALDCVTCDSGYSQGDDLTNDYVTREQLYQPDYDGLGMELHPKSVVNGSRDISVKAIGIDGNVTIPDVSLGKKAFGFTPRYSAYKVGRSCVNGGFATRSTRKTFIPYTMDKLFYPDELYTYQLPSSQSVPSGHHARPTGSKYYKFGTMLSVDDLPVSGNAWRYLGRYPWLANLTRIFSNVGAQRPYTMYKYGNEADLFKYWEYIYRTDDNYITISDVWFKAWSGMLPIAETYGTLDPDKKALEYVEKV